MSYVDETCIDCGDATERQKGTPALFGTAAITFQSGEKTFKEGERIEPLCPRCLRSLLETRLITETGQ